MYFISSTVTYGTYSSCSYYLRESKAGYLKHVDNFAHNFLYACGLMQQAYMLVLVPAGICSKPIRMACINFTITLRHWKSPESPLRNAREEVVDKKFKSKATASLPKKNPSEWFLLYSSLFNWWGFLTCRKVAVSCGLINQCMWDFFKPDVKCCHQCYSFEIHTYIRIAHCSKFSLGIIV